MRIEEIGEDGLIKRIQKRINPANNKVIVGIGDDAAVLETRSDKLLLLTTDMLVEGVHFIRGKISYRDLGYKSLAVNLSDIAAMGGIPLYAVISLALPCDFEVEDVDAYYEGLEEVAADFGVVVVGGDMTSSPRDMVINIAVVGQVGKGKMVLQNGAKEGDLIAVTGKLGGSAAGLCVLLNPHIGFPSPWREEALNKHYRPFPRVKEGHLLANTGKVNAMKDISDGLAREADIIAQASGKMLVLDAEKVPISPCVLEISRVLKKDPLEMAVQGGEDYELLFTFAPEDSRILSEVADKNGFSLYVIGKVCPGQGVFLEQGGKRELLVFKGYEHF